MEITFNDIPIALQEIIDRLDRIENMAMNNGQKLADKVDEWMTIDQLIKYLPSHPKKATIYGWVNKRTIPYNKRGKNLIFSKKSIDEWMSADHVSNLDEIEKKALEFVKNNKSK